MVVMIMETIWYNIMTGCYVVTATARFYDGIMLGLRIKKKKDMSEIL